MTSTYTHTHTQTQSDNVWSNVHATETCTGVMEKRVQVTSAL